MQANNTSVLGLDVGSVRIGVSKASRPSLLAAPLTTLQHDEHIFTQLQRIIEEEQVDELVVGLPRNMSGEETAQSKQVRDFISQLKEHTGVPIRLQDETLSSVQAEEELKNRGKGYTKGEVDALAATFILEDYLKGGE